MKWFKHYSNASENRKLKKIFHRLKEDALVGYAVYFKTLELIAKEIEPGKDNLGYVPLDIDLEYLSIEWGLPQDKLQKIYNILAEVNLIDPEEWQNGRIYCPQILEYCDEYTRKKIQKVQNTPDNVLTKSGENPEMSLQNRIEKNRIEKIRTEEKEKKEIYKERKEKEETLPTSLPEDIIQFKEFFNTTLSEDIRNSILDSLRNIFRKKSFRSARQLEMLKDIFEEEGFDARAVDATLKHIVKIKQHHWLFNYGPPAYDRFVKSWNELKHFKPFIVKPEDIPDGFPSKEALFDFLDKFCENDKQVREVIKIMKYHKGMEDAWQMYEEYKRRQV